MALLWAGRTRPALSVQHFKGYLSVSPTGAAIQFAIMKALACGGDVTGPLPSRRISASSLVSAGFQAVSSRTAFEFRHLHEWCRTCNGISSQKDIGAKRMLGARQECADEPTTPKQPIARTETGQI